MPPARVPARGATGRANAPLIEAHPALRSHCIANDAAEFERASAPQVGPSAARPNVATSDATARVEQRALGRANAPLIEAHPALGSHRIANDAAEFERTSAK